MGAPEKPSLLPAAASLAALGAAWAGLSHQVASSGAVARAVLVPIAPERYYAAQRWFVGPWLVVLAGLFALLCAKLAGALGGPVATRRVFAELVPVWAAATLALFVLPDLVLASALGHQHLARWMRFYGPLAPLVITALGSARLARAAALSRSRAAIAVSVALVLQTAASALLLR